MNVFSKCRSSIVIVASVFLLACSRKDKPEQHYEEWPVMGTFGSLSMPSAGTDTGLFDSAVEITKGEFNRANQMFSLFSTNSELSLLAASGQWTEVSSEMKDVLRLSVETALLSKGAFDPTVTPLVELWGFNRGEQRDSVPSESMINSAFVNVGYTNIHILENRILISGSSTEIDLGGVAKGYAVDMAFMRLAEAGVKNAIINLGGNMRCIGRAGHGSNSRGWKLGVRSPFNRSLIVGVLEIPDGYAVATSGNYERYVEIEGKRYAHVIDPRTGHPVSGMAGVTVIAPTAAMADAYSTALFVLGVDEGLAMIADMPGVAAVFIPDSDPMEIVVSSTASRYFTARSEYKSSVTVEQK